MLSSVSDLLTYIDDKQLTPELGGTLQYCHSEWIIFRNVCCFCPYCRAYPSFYLEIFPTWEKQYWVSYFSSTYIIQHFGFLLEDISRNDEESLRMATEGET